MVKRWNLRVLLILVVFFCTACGKSMEQQIAEQLELGNRYLAELDYEQAIVAFSKVIELEPKEIQAYTGLIRTYVGADQFENAQQIEESGVELFAEQREYISEDISEDFIYAIDDYFNWKGDKEATYDFWSRVLEWYPEAEEYKRRMESAQNELAVSYVEMAEQFMTESDTDSAVEYLEKSYELTEDEEVLKKIEHIEAAEQRNMQPMKLLTAYYDKGGEKFRCYEYSYDEEDRLIRIHIYTEADRELEWYEEDVYKEFVYDENGNQVEQITYFQNWSGDPLESRYENIFNEDGQCIRESFYNETDGLEYWWINYYDSSGVYIGCDRYVSEGFVFEYNAEPDVPEHWDYIYGDDGELVKIQRDDGLYIEFSYDEFGRCSERTTYGLYGIWNRDLFSYDESGFCIRMESYDADGNRIGAEEYEYDESRLSVPISTYHNFNDISLLM